MQIGNTWVIKRDNNKVSMLTKKRAAVGKEMAKAMVMTRARMTTATKMRAVAPAPEEAASQ